MYEILLAGTSVREISSIAPDGYSGIPIAEVVS